MKLFNLIWVLGLACVVGACARWIDQPPVQGCTVDPATGDCQTTGGAGGTGGGGAGGGGGEPGCVPGTAAFTNACTCSSLGEENIDCDYGCIAFGVTFGLAARLEVIPDAAFAGGGTFDVGFEGSFIVSETFIAGAEDTLGQDLTTAVVGRTPNSLPVQALSGATGAETIVTLPEGLELDLNEDPDGNTIPGPFPLPFVSATGSYTFEDSGMACFNFTNAIAFNLTVTEFGGGIPTDLPVDFACEPANQELINQTNVDCPNGDSDCLAPSVCDNDPVAPACEGVIEPEATAGQVCFPINGGTGGTGGSGAGGSGP